MNTKESILTLLEQNRGQSVSGEDMAKQLHISRTSVWKAIKELTKDGYRIEAVNNKGYRLCEDNDILSVQGILPFLTRKDMSERIHIYDVLESTNKTAKEMAIAGAPHGTIVIANSQTAGRGRYNRTFFSPDGHGIYMSVILHPAQLCIDTPTLVTAFAAVSVCEAIEEVSEQEPKIKWVNDIYLNNKKVCGILTEAVTDYESGSVEWMTVGMGVNFNVPDAEFPEVLRQIAGSVFTEKDNTVTRNRFIAEIVNRLIFSGKGQIWEDLIERYKSRLMMLHKNISVIAPGETYEAFAMDIDDMGRLIVKKQTGELQTLFSGEISIQI